MKIITNYAQAATVERIPVNELHRRQETQDMRTAALWYARRGFYVFPIHTPIFGEDGNCIGCTCEEWKRTQSHYGQDYHCTQPGKCPAVRWSEKSTVDEGWISWYWTTINPRANIGIDCGKSGLLVLDADSYKDSYEGDRVLSWDDQQTITSLTGGGGEHLWYRQPEGKVYGNATGDLPAGIDIRGVGGYIVAPPSVHASGTRYQFEAEYDPTCVDILSVPPALQTLLDVHLQRNAAHGPIESDIEAVQQSAARVDHFLDHAAIPSGDPKPWQKDGLKWILKQCPFNPKDDPHPNDEAAYITILANGAISCGCHHSRCQRKIDKEAGGKGWQLAKQLTGFTDLATTGQDFAQQLTALRGFVHREQFKTRVGTESYRSSAIDKKVADAILDIAQTTRRFVGLRFGYGQLRAKVNVGSRQTVKRSLGRLNGWFIVHDTESHTYSIVTSLISGTLLKDTTSYDVPLGNDSLFTQEKARDVWSTGTARRYRDGEKDRARTSEKSALADGTRYLEWRDKAEQAAIDGDIERATEYHEKAEQAKLRIDFDVAIEQYDLAEAIMPLEERARALGGNALLVLSALVEHGSSTRKELIETTGLTISSIATATRKLEVAEILRAERLEKTRTKEYDVNFNYASVLDACERSCRAYGMGAERVARDAEQSSKWLNQELKRTTDEAAIQRIRRRLAKIAQKHSQVLTFLHPDWTKSQVDHYIDAHTQQTRTYIDPERTVNEQVQSDYTGISFFMATKDVGEKERERMAYFAGYSADEVSKWTTIDFSVDAEMVGVAA